MAATPTTKSQVQAYRFVLRRMEHALVRKDAVMLHDPMRTQVRATAVGIILGILGLAGFALFSVFRPAQTIDQATILVSKTSTQTFVVVPDQNGTRVLHPVYNLSSARLIVGQPAPVTLVDDAALDSLPRGAELGIVGGPDVLPAVGERPAAVWTVCDALLGDASAPSSALTVSTTVLSGDLGGGADPLTDGRSLLVSAPGGTTQLLFTSGAGVVRAGVDLRDTAIARALDLTGKVPRPVSEGLLNTVPEVAPLVVPDVPGRRSTPAYARALGPGLAVGKVISVQDSGGTTPYVLLPDGVQKVSPVVSGLLQSASGDVTPVQADVFVAAPDVPEKGRLDLSRYPLTLPKTMDAAAARVSCLSWDGTSAATAADPSSFDPVLTLRAGNRLPLPEGARAVPLAGADDRPGGARPAGGFHLDSFYVQPGRASVVQTISGGQPLGVGTRYLVADTGTRFGIPDKETAGVLGLGSVTSPAPESVVALLPRGTELSTANARQSHNGVAPDPAAEPFAAPAGG
jgi:type VII secretion protein EccB